MDKFNYMQLAINLANKAAKQGDIPVGAVVVCNGNIVGTGYNKKEKKKNALMHAEIIAINKASKKLKDYRLEDCELYVTFEPCLMCVGAILSARIKKVYFGAFDNRFGACKLLTENNFNHKASFEGGVMEEECSKLLTSFFKGLRQNKEQKRK
ncbi:MAG: nucleoside deaminase [Clostridia bacterium]|nr:nucleoside deaminase [Clostridia bacterium]